MGTTANIFIVAHPDDELISCGAYLLDSAENNDIDTYCIMVTDNVKNMNYSKFFTFEKIMKEIKVKYSSLYQDAYNFKHSDLSDVHKDLKECAGFNKNKYKKINVFTHHPKDFNIDHSEVSKAVLLAFRDIPSSIFFIDSYSPEGVDGFKPQFYYYYNQSTFEKKIKYLNLYFESNVNSVIYDKKRIFSFDFLNRLNIEYKDKPYSEKFEVYRLM